MTYDRVYIVVGSCGEYSDWRCWHVAAYRDKERAEEHLALCREAAVKIATLDDMDYIPGGIDYDTERSLAIAANPVDPFMEQYSTDPTAYALAEISLVDHVDQYQELGREAVGGGIGKLEYKRTRP